MWSNEIPSPDEMVSFYKPPIAEVGSGWHQEGHGDRKNIAEDD